MKPFYRTATALCLFLAVMFMIVGTATAESNLSGSGGLNPDGKLPAVDFSFTPEGYPHAFFFEDRSEYTDYVTCDFGDTNIGRYDYPVTLNNTFNIVGIRHGYANDGIYKITFTGHNQFGINSKTIYLYLKNDGTYEESLESRYIDYIINNHQFIGDGNIFCANVIEVDATNFATFDPSAPKALPAAAA